jgi:hypothetical protein
MYWHLVNSQTVGLRVASLVFALVCLMQLLRLLTGVEVFVAGHAVPLWPNAIAFLVAGGLSYWMWQLSYRGTT